MRQEPGVRNLRCRLESITHHSNCCSCWLQLFSVRVCYEHARVSWVCHLFYLLPTTYANIIDRPGMGLNAYFAYTIVGYHGTGLMSYNLALTAVFVEGFIFIFLSLIGMRQWLVKVIPVSLKVASACGIGLFLSEIGLSYNAGIGAITGATNTPLEIAGCPLEYRDDNGFCTSHKMTSSTVS
jgi:xanthine/uracil/vitamin C permease (AzgA family)